jgi:hypothetical protein
VNELEVLAEPPAFKNVLVDKKKLVENEWEGRLKGRS